MCSIFLFFFLGVDRPWNCQDPRKSLSCAVGTSCSTNCSGCAANLDAITWPGYC